jgi:hypothetical protein
VQEDAGDVQRQVCVIWERLLADLEIKPQFEIIIACSGFVEKTVDGDAAYAIVLLKLECQAS